MNVAELGERHLERFGTYTTLHFEGEEFTNARLVDEGSRLATALRALGVEPGDRVGVMLPNSPAVTVTYGAVLRVGGVVVPMLFLLAVPEVTHILADSAAKVVFTSPEFHPTVRAAVEGLEIPPIIVVTGAAPEEPGVVAYDALLRDASEPAGITDRAADDLAVISYTSGTTGRPKGVMLTHANMLFNAENTARVAPTRDGDVAVVTLPLAHLFGIGSMLVGQLFRLTGVMLPWFTAEGFFDAVATHRAQSSALVPAMVQFMLAHPDFDAVDWSSLDWVVVGAAPVPVEMADEFEKRTGAKVLEGYGLTETSPTVSLAARDEPRVPGSCGRPAPDVEVTIRDENDRVLPPGEPGEVCVRGPNVMAGYFRMPEESERALRGGWFRTGDIGHLDDDGFLFITDRTKDLIIRGGLNIYPRDVEEVLHGHPAILECAVVGVPDAKLGEQVMAYVVLRPGASAAAEDILGHAREHLAVYKTPRWVTFLDALPKTPVGKVLKRDLRERAAADAAAAGDAPIA